MSLHDSVSSLILHVQIHKYIRMWTYKKKLETQWRQWHEGKVECQSSGQVKAKSYGKGLRLGLQIGVGLDLWLRFRVKFRVRNRILVRVRLRIKVRVAFCLCSRQCFVASTVVCFCPRVRIKGQGQEKGTLLRHNIIKTHY